MNHYRVKAKRGLIAALVLGLLVLMLPQAFAQDKQYAVTELTGRLVYVDGIPISGATVKLLSTGETPERYVTTTDDQGQFALTGVPYGNYVVEFTTVEGARIHGIDSLPLGDHALEMKLSLAKRTVSKSTLYSQPMNFQVDVEIERWNKARFWKQFAIFFAIVITGGAALL